jgi:rod shape-determining protein MreC
MAPRRDTRRARLVLATLLVLSFALMTVDLYGGPLNPMGRVRAAAAAVFGPAEEAAASVVNPVADAIGGLGSGANSAAARRLEKENAVLRQQLRTSELDRNRVAELDRLLRISGVGQYRIKPARVIAIGAAQGFAWSVTLDMGSQDGIQPDMTVINGDGLVGRVTSVGPGTSTVLLAIDPSFAAGARMAGSMQIGILSGQGIGPLKMQLLDPQATPKKGDRLVTFGSAGGRPFVPGVPVGEVLSVKATPGALTRMVEVKPFVDFTSLDTVGVVVEPPRTDPRDSVLPPAPTPTPVPTVTVTVGPDGKPLPEATASPGATTPPNAVAPQGTTPTPGLTPPPGGAAPSPSPTRTGG